MRTNPPCASYTSLVIERIRERQEAIHSWLSRYEGANELPLYSSVDIRDAGFKSAVVDTNLFPAGFNNLCEHGLDDSVGFMREAILRRAPHGRDILIIAEEHTRNTWYLENIRILQSIIQKAGFRVKIATFLTVRPAFCENVQSVDLATATGAGVRIYCLQNLLERFKAGDEIFDLIILNNDLTVGIPDFLKDAGIPIYPSMQAGWHSRLKSYHFGHTRDIVEEFSGIIDLDPWLFSCFYSVVDRVDINREEDRQRLKASAEALFSQIAAKYEEHGINEKPYVVLKADSGTYGMGVMVIEEPQEILDLNRKKRNSLAKGKSAKRIDRLLVQEGVPTIYRHEDQVGEAVIYQIEHNLVGGFYRTHASKGVRDNLNSKGMDFHKMCPHLKKYGDCGVHHDVNVFDVYRILARIAGIAAHREIVELEVKSPLPREISPR